MPSRAYTSFLQQIIKAAATGYTSVNALSGLYLISTEKNDNFSKLFNLCVNALSGLYLISTYDDNMPEHWVHVVSMPSRAYTSFLLTSKHASKNKAAGVCQCPLGLIPHFYGTPSKT